MLNKTLPALLVAAFSAASASGAVVFTEDFEGEGNTDDNTLATYDKYPPVPSNWVAGSNGFGSDRSGLNLVGTNTVYSFRYTNSGLTTDAGVIGTLTAGTTYTISFDVSLDSTGTTDPYQLYFGTFADGAGRNDVSSGGTSGMDVLATVSGSWDGAAWSTSANASISGSTVTFVYVSDGTEGTLGDDVAIRFDGATTSANIDNVSVDVVVPEPGSLALMGLGGLMMVRRRRRA